MHTRYTHPVLGVFEAYILHHDDRRGDFSTGREIEWQSLSTQNIHLLDTPEHIQINPFISLFPLATHSQVYLLANDSLFLFLWSKWVLILFELAGAALSILPDLLQLSDIHFCVYKMALLVWQIPFSPLEGKKVSSFHSSAISYIQYRNLEGNSTFALSCVSHSCHRLKFILLIWPKFPTLITRCNPTSDPTLSFTTLSVNPEAIIFWRVFSLLWACLASFALPWPNRAM